MISLYLGFMKGMWTRWMLLALCLPTATPLNSRLETKEMVNLLLWDPKPGHFLGIVRQWGETGALECKKECTVLAASTGSKHNHLLEVADAVVFGGSHKWHRTKLPRKRDNQPWIYVDEPEMNPVGGHQRTKRQINWQEPKFKPNWIASNKPESDIVYTYGLWGTGTWPTAPMQVDDWLKKVAKARSTGQYLVSFYSDDCTDRARINYVRRLSRLASLKTFGICSGSSKSVEQINKNRKSNSLDYILSQQAQSVFCLIIETGMVKDKGSTWRDEKTNTEGEARVNSDFSKMLGLSMASGCIPVYNGNSQEAAKWMPAHSFIDATQFPTGRELASFLADLNQKPRELEKYHAWRTSSNSSDIAPYNEYLEKNVYNLACNMCEKVREAKSAQVERDSKRNKIRMKSK